ncbi:hypothetical protein DAPPUDRAFT_312300 [Daphnia pulex]|uniref:Uncharacterized protein n=1 Tax=Daphnia pulex TaxID=6669 RepID=E9G0E1_DAPPU|nr:hypothetical protein DAPPUDRAFT_312300 [Daphnia pulex]|eukprot:EFX86887.1 hypothetical protein DAPPUDRAFT_312300 [Daphnia pulex]
MVAACWIAGGIGWWFDSDSDDNSYLSDLVSCVMGACDKRDEIVQFKLCLTKVRKFYLQVENLSDKTWFSSYVAWIVLGLVPMSKDKS